MNDSLHRYSRHMVMPEIGVNGQQTLLDSSVLIVGAGGLGSSAALYLAAAGIGQIHIADPDEVEISNLQRQILHSEDSLGRSKVDSAKTRLSQLNSEIEVIAHPLRLDEATLPDLVKQVDIVVDGCDNFSTRFAVNAACVKYRTPLVSGAAIRTEGQITSFTPGIKSSPCYRCLYNHSGADQDACENAGVLGPLVGIIGSMQALETIKILLGLGENLVGRLLLFNASDLRWRELKLKADPACPVCGSGERTGEPGQ